MIALYWIYIILLSIFLSISLVAFLFLKKLLKANSIGNYIEHRQEDVNLRSVETRLSIGPHGDGSIIYNKEISRRGNGR